MEDDKKIQNDGLDEEVELSLENNADDLEEEKLSSENETNENVVRENEIEFRISEINVIIDEYQNKLYDEDTEIMTRDEYNNLLKEQKDLKNELKALRKLTRNSFWDKVKVWHLVYGVIQLFICMPYVGGIYQLCMLFYNQLYEWFGDSFANMNPEFVFFLEVVMLLAFPIINIFISWILYVNVVSKKRLDQIVFLSIWGGQIILSIISMLFVFIG